MARYIDVDAWNEFYIERTKDLESYNHYDMGYGDAMDHVDDWLDAHPTIEARPVVRGEWVPMEPYRDILVCSECDEICHDLESNFCPTCGADMRGTEDDARSESR